MRKLLSLSILFVISTSALAAVSLQQLAELTPSSRSSQDWFGISVAVSGNTAVVADFDPNLESYGAVYVYVKPANGWSNMTQVAKLTASDNGEGFGISVAINGNIIVVGAANTSNFDRSAASPGAAYVFVQPAGGWKDMTETAKLVAADGQPGDAFGNSVGVNGSTIAIGAFFVNNFSGRAYVFTRSGGGWKQAAELSASDSSGLLDYLGCSVAISGNTVVAGSFGHNNFQGASYVYVEPAGGWTNMAETAELSASNGNSSDNLGFSVSIDHNTVASGAPGVHSGLGAAYLFVEPPSGWSTTSTFNAELGPPNGIQGDSFGQSVGISNLGRAVVVGAPGQNVGSSLEQGAAYLFIEQKSGWKTTKNASELTASDGGAFDLFGASVAISESTVVIGAPESNTPGEAYVFGP